MKFNNPLKSAIKKFASATDEHLMYEKIADDIDKNIINKGVWTKAFAKSEGDETKQKAIYIELMIEHYNNEKEAQQELEHIRQIEEEKRNRIQNAIHSEQSKIYNKQQEDKKELDNIAKEKERFIKEQEERDRKLRE